MINVQPYIDKLDLLREYMFMKIDGYGKVFSINLDALPSGYSVQELINIWHQTGIMYARTDDYQPIETRQLSFEEWIDNQNKNKNNATNKNFEK